MPVAQTARIEDSHTPSFETVWAALQELTASQKETDRIVKEVSASQKESARQMKESREDFNKKLGSLTNLFGNFTLGMVAPKLREKFMDFELVFPRANPNADVNDKINDISFEIDILLENGEKAMLVEVKTKLTKERINKHTERLEEMRRYADLHGDKRTFLGAVAGFAITDEVKKAALEEGFYLIEPDGENFNITPPNGKPKEW